MLLVVLNTLDDCAGSMGPAPTHLLLASPVGFYLRFSVTCRFERVYPIPDWALPLREESERKRQRRDSDPSSESEGSDTDMDDDPISAPPLSVLLQSNRGWSRANDRRLGAKLRPEILDIARLIDANKTGGSMVSQTIFPL